MGLFSNNRFDQNYKKRPFDGYKSIVEKLDEDTKQKLDRQRQLGMIIIVAVVVLLVVVLAVTGIGVDKNRSVSGNVFTDKENVLIECFGDSLTEGYTINADGSSGIVDNTYPKTLEEKLPGLFAQDGNSYKFREIEVKNYGQSGSILRKESSGRLSGEADIVIMQYVANNFIFGDEYEGVIEENVQTIRQMGSEAFLLNYPYAEGSAYENRLEQANNYISAAAKSSGTVLIDVHSYFESVTEYTQGDLFCSDLLHLTELGYELMGNYVAEEIHQYYLDIYK